MKRTVFLVVFVCWIVEQSFGQLAGNNGEFFWLRLDSKRTNTTDINVPGNNAKVVYAPKEKVWIKSEKKWAFVEAAEWKKLREQNAESPLLDVTSHQYNRYGCQHQAGDIVNFTERNFNTDFVVDKLTKTIRPAAGNIYGNYIYYQRNLTLGSIEIDSRSNCIFVADTIFINSLSSIRAVVRERSSNSPSVRIIAKFVVFRAPLKVALPGRDPGWFSLEEDRGSFSIMAEKFFFEGKPESSDDVVFKIPYVVRRASPDLYAQVCANAVTVTDQTLLNKCILKTLDDLVRQIDLTNPAWFAQLVALFDSYRSHLPNKLGAADNQLLVSVTARYKNILNERIVNRLERIYADVLAIQGTEKEWGVDKLLKEFLFYRRQAVQKEMDDNVMRRFIDVCTDFNRADFEIANHRQIDLDGRTYNILLEQGAYGIKYYLVPSAISILPQASIGESGEKLGTLLVYTTDVTQTRAKIHTRFVYDSAGFNAVRAFLKTQGLVLEKKLPQTELIRPHDRVLCGKSISVVPYSSDMLMFDVALKDEGRALSDFFSGLRLLSFDIDVHWKGKVITQPFDFKIDAAQVRKVITEQLANNFHVQDVPVLVHEFSIECSLKREFPFSGDLCFAELIVEVDYIRDGAVADHMILPPILISSLSAQASNVVVRFAKKWDKYKIKLSGQAVYVNGRQTIGPVYTDERFINVHEEIFRSNLEATSSAGAEATGQGH